MTPDPSERSRSDDAAIGAVRREAFRGLLEGHAPAAAEIATAATLSPERIEAAIAQLRATGALEVDADGHVVGAHGLTQRATEHVIITAERVWHTWCALDAIGIPVALNLDAEVRTRCPTCAATIVIAVRDRAPVATKQHQFSGIRVARARMSWPTSVPPRTSSAAPITSSSGTPRQASPRVKRSRSAKPQTKACTYGAT
jgi:predicted transcriptional regulator